MIKKLYIVIIFIFGVYNTSYSNENCNEYKKLSVNFMKCKANTTKKKLCHLEQILLKIPKIFKIKNGLKRKKKLMILKKKL